MPAPSEKWQRLETLFHAAAELPVAARGEFLKNQCRGDPELQQEVETLLASAEAPMDFLEKPIAEAAGQMVANEAGERLVRCIRARVSPDMRFFVGWGRVGWARSI
jgi:hypothetical protein